VGYFGPGLQAWSIGEPQELIYEKFADKKSHDTIPF
jgi:hypothetical protein